MDDVGVYGDYDLYAVLTLNGPLRKIVELSQEREEAIPALVYEARGGSRSGNGSRRRRRKKSNSERQGDERQVRTETCRLRPRRTQSGRKHPS